MNKNVNLWERYLTKEIGIEFKACLYFFAILFFYCCYLLINKTYSAEILIMSEMILSTYIVGYIQVWVFNNFDEADEIKGREIAGFIVCSLIYIAEAQILNWFNRDIKVLLIFAFYVVFLYVCVFYIYKCRRRIDNKLLNDDLANFKARNK